MNYTALTSEDLRRAARSIFGDVLKIDEMTDAEIIRELKNVSQRGTIKGGKMSIKLFICQWIVHLFFKDLRVFCKDKTIYVSKYHTIVCNKHTGGNQ